MRTSTFPSAKSASTCLTSLRRAESRDHLDSNGKVPEALAECVPVLFGEDRRRREHQRLLAVDRDRERRAHRDLRLAEADVAADEPVHRVRRLEVLLHRFDRRLLVGRLAVRERRLEARDPLVLEVERDPGARLTLRVQRDQLAGQLLHRLACARLEQLPRLAAELRQRGRLRVGADVARHLAELLVRDVQAVVAAEREQEVVARDAGDFLRLEAEELADAVILVDDVVAGAQVGERLQRAAAEAALLRHATTEDLMVGQEDEPEVAPDEAAARGRDREQHLGLVGQRLARLEQARLDAPEEVLRAQRLAAMRERDDDALPGAHERRQLGLRLGEAASGDRRALRLEGERLRLRERVELRRALERGRREDAVVLPHAPHTVRLEDEIGNAVERGHEIVGDAFRLGVDEIDAPLRGGIDDGRDRRGGARAA